MRTAIDILKFLLVIGFFFWIIFRGTEQLGYHWQWYRVPKYIGYFESGSFVPGPLIHGLIVTCKISFISLIISFIIGLTTAFFRLSDAVLARILSRWYLECIRNTPLLVQIFFMYFVISPILGISRFSSAVLALSLFEGAYASEIFRAGILSVHKSQTEAAFGLGMNTFQTYRWIILPQAIRRVLPPLTSQAVSLVKDSALVSVIAIYDLTMQGQAIIAETFLTFELWFTIAFIYLIITLGLSLTVSVMEKRFGTTYSQ